ncbi:MAG: beta-eliminating lyase-related protein [Acidimicrobiia bacterium]|nr:beta-eliminating lyase-related protein [Acidimicrobiia bacterium]
MMKVELRSDNAVGVAPEMLAALAAANHGTELAYGGDTYTEHLHNLVREVFEHPSARVFPVTTGTAANSIGLSAMAPPWGAVLCQHNAHIIVNEGGATSMFGAGLVMKGLGGDSFKIDPAELESFLEATGWGDPHVSQPAVVSLTSPTEYGTVYQPKEVATVAEIARRWNLGVHMDGARFANAAARLGCSPADLTWRAGVDVLTLGATKNGAMSTDAIVSFDDAASEQLVYRTKRAGHTASKMRFQSAQLIAYLTDGLWLELAGHANRAMERLASGLGQLDVGFVNDPDVNILFVTMPPDAIDRLAESGVLFYRMDESTVRFVTAFATTDEQVDTAIALVGAALG